MRIILSTVYVVSFLTLTLTAHSQDSFDDVLHRLKISQASEIGYTQTRQLQLLQSPWQGSGEMYLSPRQMIIAQRYPKELYILITRQTMQYLDIQQNIYHHKKLKGVFEIPQMAVFVDLIYGEYNADTLSEKYETQFSSDSNGWKISLTDKNESNVEVVDVSGLNGSPADSLEMLLVDGDRTSWQFSPTNTDENIIEKMDLIVKKIHDYKNGDRSQTADR